MNIVNKETTIILTSNFSLKTMGTRKQEIQYWKCLQKESWRQQQVELHYLPHQHPNLGHQFTSLLLFEVFAKVSGKAQDNGLSTWPLSPPWEMEMEFLAPGLGTDQFWLWLFREVKISLFSRWKLISLSLPSCYAAFQINTFFFLIDMVVYHADPLPWTLVPQTDDSSRPSGFTSNPVPCWWLGKQWRMAQGPWCLRPCSNPGGSYWYPALD